MAGYRVEHIDGGRAAAFYIDDSLQFDTRDEYVYHEALFLPPAALAGLRSPVSQRGLVLGGGDAMGVRELLKIPSISRIDLVDYDPHVLHLARTVFAPFNGSSLQDPRVHVHVEDARDFVRRAAGLYDYIVADFTFPEDLAGCSLFTQAFFHSVRACLKETGVVALNAFSPEQSPEAYWSVYRTLTRACLHVKPYHVRIPSFSAHAYGAWGFFLASPVPVMRRELDVLPLPPGCRYLRCDRLQQAMAFDSGGVGHGLRFGRVLGQPADLRGLLNLSGIFAAAGGVPVDFSKDQMPQEIWKYFIDSPGAIFFSMSAYWKERVLNILHGMDWPALMKEAENKIGGSMTSLANKEVLQRALLAFIAVIIVTNMLCPDNAFAKGYYGGGYGYHGHSGYGSGGAGSQVVFMSQGSTMPFHSAYWMNAAYVPDMSGNIHPKFSLPAVSSQGVGQAPENAFFAVNDTLYVMEQGHVVRTLPHTAYFYQLGTDRVTVYKSGQDTAVIELALEQEDAAPLQRSVDTLYKALVPSIERFEQWLAWAGPTGAALGGIATEQKELEKLKLLKRHLERLKRQDFFPSTTSGIDGSSLVLAAGMRLTYSGNLAFKMPDGSWQDYVFRGFKASGVRDVLPVTPDMDAFCESILIAALGGLPPQDPLRALISDRLREGGYGT